MALVIVCTAVLLVACLLLGFTVMKLANERHFKALMDATVNAAIEKFATTSDMQLKRNGAEFAVQSMKNLEPLMANIREFREKVEVINKDAIDRTGELKGQIKTLLAQSDRVSHEANELANAIRGDSQVVGAWGELQLKRVLERAGLEEGIGYTYQDTFTSEDSVRKDLRTDVLVKLPGDRWVVVDSKNTVESYVQYKNATDENDIRTLRAEILKSVRNHIDELKRAAYGKNIKNAFGYSLAYIPFEEVYLLALKSEVKIGETRKSLFDYAWENNVILVNAAILMPALKLIELMWQNVEADERARKIIRDADDLCDKFANFLENYIKMGKALSSLSGVYNEGARQLAFGSGNFLKRLSELASANLSGEKKKLLESGTDSIENKIPDVSEAISAMESKLNA